MKKFIKLIFSLALAFSLAACSEKAPQNSNNTSSLPSQNANISDATNNKFTGVVAVDNEKCLLKITEIIPNDSWGFTLNAYFENKSADEQYIFLVEDSAINGIKCSVPFSVELPAGKKANHGINFSTGVLEKNGVTSFTDIELRFRVYAENSPGIVARETVHIYPQGKENAAKFVRESKPQSDHIILDNEYATVIVTGYEKNRIHGDIVNLFLINKTDRDVLFSAEEVSINNFMANPLYAERVSAGKCAFSAIRWPSAELTKNDIKYIDIIEFKLLIHDVYNDENLVNQKITLA